jgi:beta-glucanase (GH16 family)
LRRFAYVAGVAVLLSLGVAATQATATSTPCGGERPGAPKGQQWVCSFDDEFNATKLDLSKWTPANSATTRFTTGPAGSRVCYENNPSTISESGGYLRLSVRSVPKWFLCGLSATHYIGGSVSGFGKFSQTYGRFEVRAKFPDVTVAGLQETLWLWPVNQNKYGREPASGEIDFAEAYSSRSTQMIPYIHYVAAKPDPSVTSLHCSIGNLNAFHTYALVWTPTYLAISVDGSTCLVDRWQSKIKNSASAPFNQPFFLALTQALGVNSDAYVTGKTPLPATTTIDYARIWKLH